MTEQAQRPRIGRLFAEGVVIVVSILLAFTVDAWWDSRQDRDRGMAYLVQLEAELEGTVFNNRLFDSLAAPSDTAAGRLFQSYYEAIPPSADSVEYWLRALNFYVTQPRLGTAEMLVATGDLRLIRNDSLRSAIPTYLSQMRAFDAFEADGEAMYRAAIEELAEFVDLNRLRMEVMSDQERTDLLDRDLLAPLAAGPLRELPSQNLPTVIREPETHRILSRIRGAKDLMKAYRDRMRNRAEVLLARVRAAQEN